jgi:hypothetical protein
VSALKESQRKAYLVKFRRAEDIAGIAAQNF